MGEQFELGGIEPRNQRRSIQFAGKRERIARAGDRFVNSYTQLYGNATDLVTLQQPDAHPDDIIDSILQINYRSKQLGRSMYEYGSAAECWMKDSIHQIDPILVAGEAYSDLEYIANEDGRTTRTYIGIMAGFGDLVYEQAARINELKENLKLQLQQLAMRAAMRQGILANGSTDQLTPQFKSDVVREHLRQYDLGRAHLRHLLRPITILEDDYEQVSITKAEAEYKLRKVTVADCEERLLKFASRDPELNPHIESQLRSLRALAKSDPDADNRLRLVRFQSAPLHRLNIKLQGYAYPEGGSIVQTPVLWKAKDLSKFNAPGFDNGPRKRRSNAKLPVKANGELEDAFLPSLSVYLVA